MNILIFGGNGFIGSYVAKILNNRGNSVAVIDRQLPDSHQAIKGIVYQRTFRPNQRWSRDIQTVIIMTQPDPLTFSVIIEYLSRIPKLKKIVYLSTLQLYPDSPRRQDETAGITLLSEYEKHKYYEELALRQFIGRKKVALCITRLSNVYGDVKNKGIVHLLIQQLLRKTDLIINGDGRQKKDFIFVEDAAELISYLVTYKQHVQCEIFNICTGKGHSINDVAAILEHISREKLVFRHAPFPSLEKKNNIGDNAKIIKASHYRIRYSLAAGLRKALDNYKKHI